CSSARSRSESVRGLIPEHECSSSVKRRGPSERSWTSTAVHFAPRISAQAATEQQLELWILPIVRTPRIVVRSGRRVAARQVAARQGAPRANRRAGLRGGGTRSSPDAGRG